MMYQPAGTRKNTPARPKARAGSSKASSGKSSAQASARPARAVNLKPDNVLRLRISSAVISLLALAGIVYWLVSAKGNYSTELIAGVILLALLAGLMAFAAVRTEYVIKRAAYFNNRR